MALYLRTEARPADWKDLDATQKEAFEIIIQMIVEAVDGVDQTDDVSSEDKVDWLSTNRASRTGVISGGRGTGKTTLLASLIKATKSNDAYTSGQQMPKGVLESLLKVRRRIIWLEPMDMETIPAESNLLASILVRVEDVISRLGNIGFGGKSIKDSDYMGPSLLGPGPEFNSALLDLQRIQNAIALAWEGNLQEHSSQIDPDAYAVELLRSENARLSVNKNLDEVLNMVAQKILWTANIQNPLFLLPVDDLDLNPLACLKLLRLLRMISVPRIFSLILGDVYVAEVVMNLKLSGDLAQATNRGVFSPQLLSLSSDEIAAVAGEISANAMRKLIPPNQRIYLENMRVLEALNFRPLTTKNNEMTFHHLLSEYPIFFEGNNPFRKLETDVDGTVRNLKDFLLVRPLSMKPSYLEQAGSATGGASTQTGTYKKGGTVTSSDIEQSIYTGLSFLKGTPRAISDLWFALGHLIRFKDEQQQYNSRMVGNYEFQQNANEILHKKLIEAVATHCRDILLEERGISPTQRIRFKDSIRRNIKGDWEIGQLPLRLFCDTTHLYEITENEDSKRKKPPTAKVSRRRADRVININKAILYKFEVLSAFEHGDIWGDANDTLIRGGIQLSSEASSAIVILHDLLTLGINGASFISPLLARGWDFVKLAVTLWRQDEASKVELPWPQPLCKSFWEYDIFKSTWRESLERIDTDISIDWAAFVWLSLGSSIVDRVEPIRPASYGYVSAPDWQNIANRLLRMRYPESLNILRRDALEWLTKVFLIVMPEYGLPDSVVRTFVESSDLREYWIEHRQSILPRRTTRLATMVENNLEQLAFDMLEMTPDSLKALSPSKEEILKQAERETAKGEFDQKTVTSKTLSPNARPRGRSKL